MATEKTFPIHRYAAAGLVRANAVESALRAAGAGLIAQADDLRAKSLVPVLEMLGIEEGIVVRVDDNNGEPTVTIRVPEPPAPVAPVVEVDA